MLSRQTSRCSYLDSLKGIAIIAVIVTHSGGSDLPGILGQIGASGARGVQLFLMVSAFLNFKSAERFFCKPEGVTVKRTVEWYLKKLVRLVPLYYIAIVLGLITGSWSTYWLGAESCVSIRNIAMHFLFLHGFVPQYSNSVLGVEWYLGVLVIFLVLTPWLYKVLSLEKTLAICLLILVVKPPLLSHLLANVPKGGSDVVTTYITNFNPVAQSMTWMIGVLLYYLRVEKDNGERIKSAALSYLLLAFSILMLYGQIRLNCNLYRFESMEMYSIWFAILMLSQMIYPSRFISNSFLKKCGEYSYGMYLFQFIWLKLYDRVLVIDGFFGMVFRIVAAVVGLLLFSIVVTKCIDAPIQKRLGIVIDKTK